MLAPWFSAGESFAPIVVGAPYEDSLASQAGSDSAPNSGAVYLKWKTLQGQLGMAFIKAPNADSKDRFGEAAILSGNNQVLVVGAPGETGCGPMLARPNTPISEPPTLWLLVPRMVWRVMHCH